MATQVFDHSRVPRVAPSRTISLVTQVPGPRSSALSERRLRSVSRGVSQITPVYVDSASGATVTDVDGNVFLDFAGGIGCILHTCFMVAAYEGYI